MLLHLKGILPGLISSPNFVAIRQQFIASLLYGEIDHAAFLRNPAALCSATYRWGSGGRVAVQTPVLSSGAAQTFLNVAKRGRCEKRDCRTRNAVNQVLSV